MQRATTTEVILETRTPLQDGNFPVKLRVTHNRESRYFLLRDKNGSKISLSKDTFKKVSGDKPRNNFKFLKIHLSQKEKEAREIIKELSIFSFEAFRKRFFGKHGGEQDLFTSLQNAVNKLKNENRISTSISYNCALKSLKDFTNKNILLFEKVNVDFLSRYENWMLQKNNSPTTIGIYTRNVRTCFNEAIRDGVVNRDLYPFGRGKYRIPTGKNIKKAISDDEIALIANYPSIDGSSEQRYRDYWLFQFLCNGINATDMANLKYENIQNGSIIFSRQKTRRELKSNPINIEAVITEHFQSIIDRWGNKPALSDEYIFPILKEKMTAEQKLATIQQERKLINKYIDRVAKAVGIKNKVTTYVSRHSFATLLMRSGASTPFIKETLGHSSQKTTENYLGDFPKSEKEKWANVAAGALNIKSSSQNDK